MEVIDNIDNNNNNTIFEGNGDVDPNNTNFSDENIIIESDEHIVVSDNDMIIETKENNDMVIETKNDKKVIEFLENNLGPLTSCPISGTTFFNGILCSDGFCYEENVMNEYFKRYGSSPMTREPMQKTCYQVDLLTHFIKLADDNKLEVCQDKYISDLSFKENHELIISCIENGKYDKVYKFKDFILNYGEGDKMFCYRILIANNITNIDGYVECIKFILDNSIDLDFVKDNGSNILHMFYRYCQNTNILDYILLKFTNEQISNMVNIVNRNGDTPMKLALDNSNPSVCSHIIDKDDNIIIDITTINSFILKKLTDDLLIKLLGKVENINMFDNNDMTPMFCAIRTGNYAVIKYLLSKEYNMKLTSPQHKLNAYYYAAKHAKVDVMKYIIEMCDNLEETNADGWAIIHFVSYYNSFDCIMDLIEKFVNMTTTVNLRFNDADNACLPVNLIEMNRNLGDEERQNLMNDMFQMMGLQLG